MSLLIRLNIYIDYKNKTAHINKPVDKHICSTNMFAAGRPILNLKTAVGTQIHLGMDTGASQSSISSKLVTGIPDQNIVKKLITNGVIGSDAVRNSCLHIDYLNGTAEIAETTA